MKKLMTGLREYIRDQNKKAVQIAIGKESQKLPFILRVWYYLLRNFCGVRLFSNKCSVYVSYWF